MALQLIWQDGAEFIGITFSLHSEKFRSTAKHLTAIRVKMEMLQQILPLSPAWVVDAAVLHTYHFSFLFFLYLALARHSVRHWIENDERPSSRKRLTALNISMHLVCVCAWMCYFHYDCSIFITLDGVYIARSLRITCLND